MTLPEDLISLAERVENASGPDREILNRLDRSGPCWLWTGPVDERGRGRVSRAGRPMLHHRAVWEILVGPIPHGALLCHDCDNPRCANPQHLYVGDGKSNVADMFERGRHWTQKEPGRAREVGLRSGRANTWHRGEGNPRAKLSREEVAEIAGSGDRNRVLAGRYAVDITTIQRIKRGALWTS